MKKTKVKILKYGNRKLYSLNESRYTDLQKIFRLMKNKVDFSVFDHKTSKDITRQIKLSAIFYKLDRSIDNKLLNKIINLLES